MSEQLLWGCVMIGEKLSSVNLLAFIGKKGINLYIIVRIVCKNINK